MDVELRKGVYIDVGEWLDSLYWKIWNISMIYEGIWKVLDARMIQYLNWSNTGIMQCLS